MSGISIFALIIGAIFVNNVVLSQFLGICPFLGVSKDVKSSVGMGGAVLFVMLLATLVTWILNQYVLVAFGLEYLQTIVYILVIAALVQMVEIILKKIAPALYQALGVFLPLITTNCAVLGVALIVVAKHMTLAQSMIYSASIAVGFTLALVIFAGIREQLDLTGTPKGMKGVPIALVSAGILAMAFMGFNGLVPLP
ncbi:MAG: electron transport complex protein RnfA [Bacteroidales bacterium]|jgi:electron transport complex protein RnfA|nr:electron transport complex protein RnfA [Bacteroidales bacterium]